MHELVCYRDYVSGEPLAYWRSTSGLEVDFLIGDHTAIEIKVAANVWERDLESLHALAEERRLKHLLCVSLEPRPRRVGGVKGSAPEYGITPSTRRVAARCVSSPHLDPLPEGEGTFWIRHRKCDQEDHRCLPCRRSILHLPLSTISLRTSACVSPSWPSRLRARRRW